MQPASLIATFLIIVAGFSPQAGAQSALYANEVSRDSRTCKNLAFRVEQDTPAGNYTEAASVCSVSCAKGRQRITCAANETCRCYCGPDGEPVCNCSARGKG